ncbi:MAG: hypothetical protein ACYC3X_17655 [Pirellulaceae bacterium]
MISTQRLVPVLALVCWTELALPMSCAAPAAEDHVALESMVRADWEAQEKRLGRGAQSAEAIQAALQRTSQLLNDLAALQRQVDFSAETAELQRLTLRATQWASMLDEARVELYVRIRTLTRQVALKNPLVGSHPIVFMQRNRAVGYMLYEYLGWYYAYGYDPTNGAKSDRFATPKTGGGVYVLDRPGQSLETRELTAGGLPPGHFVTLALSHDAQTIYFAYADPTGRDPYDSPGFVQAPAEQSTSYNTFHL